MNKTIGIGIASLSAVAVFVVTAREAHSQVQGSLPAYIRLQSVTPGVSQNGHSNINGTSIASQFVGGGSGLTGVNADQLDGLNSTSFLQSVPNPLTLSGNSSTHIIQGTNTSTTTGSAALSGVATATFAETYGVFGQTASQFGRGVYGLCTSTGPGVAGYFKTLGNGSAVYAEGLATGVFAKATGNSTTAGVAGIVEGDGGGSAGVSGVASSTTGFVMGVSGFSNSNSGIGVLGRVSNANGDTYGGSFQNPSFQGVGVYGGSLPAGNAFGIGGSFEARGDKGIGAYAIASSTSGNNYAVYGVSNSNSGVGVKGVALANGTNIGVWGVTGAANGWGVYSDGRMGASGTKLFRIDHPADPENMYLQHYCNESPTPQNTYQGTVVTDANGSAIVRLPAYYESINKDAKVQLTVDDESEDFVFAKVAGGVQGGQFRIRTSKPRTKVYWMVSADRYDRWVQKYGTPVEVAKEDVARGTYQHPELYGLPESRGIQYKLAKEGGMPRNSGSSRP